MSDDLRRHIEQHCYVGAQLHEDLGCAAWTEAGEFLVKRKAAVRARRRALPLAGSPTADAGATGEGGGSSPPADALSPDGRAAAGAVATDTGAFLFIFISVVRHTLSQAITARFTFCMI